MKPEYSKALVSQTLNLGWSNPFLGDKIRRKSRPRVLKPTSRILLYLWVPAGSRPLLTMLCATSDVDRVSKCLTRFERSDEMEATIKSKMSALSISTIFLHKAEVKVCQARGQDEKSAFLLLQTAQTLIDSEVKSDRKELFRMIYLESTCICLKSIISCRN